MTQTKLDDYLRKEYPKAVTFYDTRAVSSKRYYRAFSVYLLLSSATLTVVTGVAPEGHFWKLIVPIISATIGVAASMLAHFKFHENWLSYRATWDALERERRLFEAGIPPYDNHETVRCEQSRFHAC
jgi:hypothetical protein